MRIRHPRGKGVPALAGAVALLVVAGVAYAAIPDSAGVYTACKLNGIGTIRLIDPSLPSTSLLSHCTALESQISWNQKGQKGDPGAPGENGVSPTVAQLSAGDSHCPAGGAAITDAGGTTAYVCSGANGQNGTNGKDGQSFSGTFTSPNKQFSLSVTDGGVEITGPDATVTLPSSGGVDIQSNGNVSIKGNNVDTVANNETTTVQGNRTEAVGQDETISVGRDRTVTVDRDETVAVQRDRTETVGRNQNVTIDGNGTETVGAGESITVAGNRTETVGQDETIKVGGDRTENVSSNETVKVGGALALRSGGALNLDGSLLGLNASAACRPVARVGDMVDPDTELILTGSPDICID